MLQAEFEKRIGCEVSVDEYEVIEFVYAHHPLISEVEGKDQVAMLYKTFGFGIFNEMMPKAELAKQMEDEILKLRGRIAEMQSELSDKISSLQNLGKKN